MERRKDPFTKQLMALVFPIAFQQFMLSLVSASDAFMLGMLTQDDLSAVSLAGQITFVENLFLLAMTIGLSMFAAQYWGKGDVKSVEKIFAYVMKLTAIVTFCFFAAGILIPKQLMHIFTNDPVLIEKGAAYIRVVAPSYFLTGVSQIYLCILKNSGRAVKSSLISSVSVVVNIVLNAILIFGLFGAPKMEIAGAALATVLARVIEVSWCIFESRRADIVRLRWKYIRQNDRLLTGDFWKYTAPVLGNEIVWGIGFTMSSVILGHLGSDAVAANSIATVVKNLIACFCNGIGSGGGIMVGNELGAGHLEKAKEYGNRLCKMAVISGAVSGLIILALSPLIVRLANLTPTAVGYLRVMLLMSTYYMIGKSINSVTIGGIFCAGGDSKFGLKCDAITLWCVIVPLGFLSAFVWRLPVLAVCFILYLDEMIKLPAVYIHYKKYLWVKDLTRDSDGENAVGEMQNA